jgi:hypothetical protein
MNRSFNVSIISLMTLIFGLMNFGHARPTMTYQGQLTGDNGVVTASYAMTFRIYQSADLADNAEPLWEEVYDSVSVVDGSFAVELGSSVALEGVSNGDGNIYLGVTIANNAEMSPRMKIGTALRAHWAAHARDVTGENIHPRTVSSG